MLNNLRESFKKKPYLKWVMWLTAFSLTMYLGYYFIEDTPGQGPGSEEWAARVNGETIPATRFLTEARNRDARYRQLLGEQYEAMKERIRLGDEVLRDLVAVEIQRQEAEKLGLRATPQEVAREIVESPSFQDETGNFIGRERYAQVIERQIPGGVAAFEQLVAQDVQARKWRNLVTEPALVANAEVEELYRQRYEKTTIDYVLVRTQDQALDSAVSDDELRRGYDTHPASYERPAGRKVAVALVERQTVANQIQIADEEVAAYYEANRQSFSHPEQRRARHILLDVDVNAPEAEVEATRRKAEQLLQRIKGGEDFAALAAVESQDPTSAVRGGDLGFFGRNQMVGPFDQAVFETPVGEFAPVVRTDFGFHVIEVTDERPAGEAPLAEVREELRRRLGLQRAAQRVDEIATRISSEAETPQQLRDVATREGVSVRSMTVRPGDPLPELGPFPGFLDAVMALETGAVSRPLGVSRGAAVVAVEELIGKTVTPFEEVKAQVKADLLNQRLRDTARRRAEQAFAGAKTIADVAKRLELEQKSSRDLAPGDTIPGTGGPSAELRRALFGPDAAVGRRGVADVPGGTLVYEITRREPFDPAAFEQARPALRSELLEQRREALLQSILGELVEAYEVEINQPLIDRVSG